MWVYLDAGLFSTFSQSSHSHIKQLWALYKRKWFTTKGLFVWPCDKSGCQLTRHSSLDNTSITRVHRIKIHAGSLCLHNLVCLISGHQQTCSGCIANMYNANKWTFNTERIRDNPWTWFNLLSWLVVHLSDGYFCLFYLHNDSFV